MDNGIKLLTHYSPTPVVLRDGSTSQEPGLKPSGFWVSVDEAGDGWADWCRAEQFRLESLSAVQTVTLASDSKVLWIKTAGELAEFDQKFQLGRWDGVDWPRVAQSYQGIIIAPYQWRHRNNLMWYYGWDCASGCIWDTAAIQSVTLSLNAEAA